MGAAATTPAEEPGAAGVDETGLIDALRRGDPAASEAFVRANTGRLLTVARRFLNNEEDARDTVQDAFLAAFRSLDSFHGQAKLSTWLHQILIHRAIAKLRHRKIARETPIEELLPRFHTDGHPREPAQLWGEPEEPELLRRETRDLVRQSINRLPDAYRTVLLLRDIEGMSINQTAQVLETTPSAVKLRLHRARQALRTLLDRHFRGDFT